MHARYVYHMRSCFLVFCFFPFLNDTPLKMQIGGKPGVQAVHCDTMETADAAVNLSRYHKSNQNRGSESQPNLGAMREGQDKYAGCLSLIGETNAYHQRRANLQHMRVNGVYNSGRYCRRPRR